MIERIGIVILALVVAGLIAVAIAAQFLDDVQANRLVGTTQGILETVLSIMALAIIFTLLARFLNRARQAVDDTSKTRDEVSKLRSELNEARREIRELKGGDITKE